MQKFSLLTLLVFLFFGFCIPAQASVYYVKADATSGSGTSWAEALNTLQEALDFASSGDEIWVAAGTYYPSAKNGGTGERYRSFQMINGVSIYGGFTGSETSLGDRDVKENETILSGDIGVTGDNADNCYHVFYHPSGIGLDETAVLDGFTITDGNANGSYPHNYGGGMYNSYSSPNVKECTFKENTGEFVGAMNNYYASPILSNCSFSNNSATIRSGGILNNYSSITLTGCLFNGNHGVGGGGIANFYSTLNLTNCSFIANTAEFGGGGIYSYSDSSITLTNCIFNGNTAEHFGGGTYSYSSFIVMTGCSFSGNTAVSAGGGMYNYYLKTASFSNCTVSGNTAYVGGGMYNSNSGARAFSMTNCILWGNEAVAYSNILFEEFISPSPTVGYNNIQGCGASGDSWDSSMGTDNGGNIDADPLFIRNPDPGYDNKWGTDDDDYGDLHLKVESPCTDAGNPASDTTGSGDVDFDDEVRFNDGDGDGSAIIDIGSDEYHDTDEDGLPDIWELDHKLNPNNKDSDHDSLMDGDEDADDDGLTNLSELNLGTNPENQDSDGDGLFDDDEALTSLTDPNRSDSDKDGLRDQEELKVYTTDPLDPDSDDDHFNDGVEISRSTDPLNPDSFRPIYVKSSASGSNNGLSWTNAFTDLQAALNSASAGDIIWVAAGTYYPTIKSESGVPRSESFQLLSGVSIYGGFSGTETSISKRDIQANPTILSGDIGILNDSSDNCYHVIYHPDGINPDKTALLDGFTITGGNADSDSLPHNSGGGVYDYYSSPTYSNCTFSENTGYNGGAVYSASYAYSAFNKCIFNHNIVTNSGGGMFCPFYASPELTNCTFSGNTAAQDGGGANLSNGSPSLINCIFTGNTAGRNGGAVEFYSASVTMTNSIFSGNAAIQDGGAMYIYYNCSPLLTNCTFSGNSAGRNGGGIYNYSISTLLNCIMWQDTAASFGNEIYNQYAKTFSISYSNIDGSGGSSVYWDASLGVDSGGNIESDPLFAENPDAGDDELWGTDDDNYGDLHLTSNSPCIDEGNPLSTGEADFEGEQRIFDGDFDETAIIDMGADEYVDTDGDTIPDYIDTDDDNDGLTDEEETNNYCTDPLDPDSDDDGLLDGQEAIDSCTKPCDADSDDDGIIDGVEDANHNKVLDPGETNPCDPDTDADGLQDGTEMGLTLDDVGPDTDTSVFIPDENPSTTTNALDDDTDNDGIIDGEEDSNHNGTVDGEETDPNVSGRSTAMPWIPLLLLGN